MGKINRPGFTMIEIVVVAGIMALFSITLVSVFLATVRGGGKSQLTQIVHQEGDFVLKRLVNVMRGADSVICGGNQATVTTATGSQIIFSLVDNSGVTRVASDSASFLSGTAASVTDLNFDCDPGLMGNQVVTISLELSANPTGQVQEKSVQTFTTSVSTRQR